jgi:hypothetical protein
VFVATVAVTDEEEEAEAIALLDRLVLLCDVVVGAEEELDVILAVAMRREGSDRVTEDDEDEGVVDKEGVELVAGLGV